MSSALIDQMVERHGYPVLDTDDVAAFVAAHDEVVLFFAGDPAQYPESNDVAMILPELVKAFDGRLRAGLVGKAAERTLQARFGFATWPALVFLRRGAYLGTITRVQTWDDYLREIRRLLDAGPADIPGVGVPVVGAPGQDRHP